MQINVPTRRSLPLPFIVVAAFVALSAFSLPLALPLSAQWLPAHDTLMLGTGGVERLVLDGQRLLGCTADGIYFSPGPGEGVVWGLQNVSVGCPVHDIIRSGSDLIIGTSCGVYRSPDNGAHFTPSGLTQNVRALAALNTVLLAGVVTDSNGMWLSYNNGGVSWFRFSGADKWAVTSIVVHGGVASATSDGSKGTTAGVIKSINGGLSWDVATNPFSSNPGSTILYPFSDFIVATNPSSNPDSTIFISGDDCDSWQLIATGLTGKTIRSVTSSAQDLFAATDSGVYQFRVGGTGWSNVGDNLGAWANCQSIVAGDSMLFVTEALPGEGAIAKSLVWRRPLTEFQPGPFSLDIPAPRPACAGDSNSLHVITTGGKSPYVYEWRQFNGDPIPDTEFVGGVSRNHDAVLQLAPTEALDVRITVTDAFGTSQIGTGTMPVIPIPKPHISQQGNELVCDVGSATYQWLNAQNAEIAGADSQRFRPNAPGRYSVIAALNGCSGTSPSFEFAVDAVREAASNDSRALAAYPNPATGTISLSIPNALGTVQGIDIYDAIGRSVVKLFDWSVHENSLRVSNLELPGGVYVIQIRGSQSEARTRFEVARPY